MTEHISITTPVQGSPSHISWGSVIAGVVIAIAVLATLSELCMAVGLGILKPQDPSQDANIPVIASSGAIAWILSAIVAIFVGSWAAGHLARQRNETDTVLHGLIVWGASILLMILIGASAVGVVLGGGFSLLRTGVHATGVAVGSAAEGAGSAVQGMISQAESGMGSAHTGNWSQEPLFNWNSIRYSAENLLKKKSGQQDSTRSNADAGVTPPEQSHAPDGTVSGNHGTQNPSALKHASNANTPDGNDQSSKPDTEQNSTARETGDPMSLVSRLFSNPSEPLQQTDKDDLVSMLTANTSLSQADAAKKVQEWEQMSQKAKQQYDELKGKAEQKVRDMAAKTAKALSDAAWLCFVAIVLGASSAMLGAHLGGPRYVIPLQDNNQNLKAG